MRRPLDSELPAELRAELERSRRAGHDYDTLAKLPQLRAALNAAPALASDPPPQHAGNSSLQGVKRAHLQLAPAAWKLTLLAVTVGASAFVAWRARNEQATTLPHAPAAQPAPRGSTTRSVAAPQPSAPEPRAPEPAAEERDAPAPAASPVAPSERSSRREIAQLVRIRALLAHDPEAAYRLARQSEREFPRGVLSEERQALEIVALEESGEKQTAARKAREFFQRFPQSPMRGTVEAALRQ